MSRPGGIPCAGGSASPGVISPHLALPDGIWNNGEGFPSGSFAPDHGAYHDADHQNLALSTTPSQSDVHSYWFSGGTYWHSYAPGGGTPVNRFVGYLRPKSLGPIAPGAWVEDAAFEIFAPTQRVAGTQLVIYVATWSTASAPPDSQGRPVAGFTYPGWRLPEGLVARVNGAGQVVDIHRPGNGVGLVLSPPAGHQVIWAYIVPRVFGRPLTFQMQRNIQLARVIDLMLTEPPGSLFLPPTFTPINDVDRVNSTPKLIIGGSFGGLVAQLAVLAHPEVFHGAAPSAFSASLRRVPGEQSSYNQIGRSLGIWGPESSKGPFDVLWWGFYLRQIGWDYFNASTTMRLRVGDAVRPMTFLIADEDTVTSGVDSLPLLSGTRGYPAFGYDAGPPLVAWSVVDKRCHGEPGLYRLPISGIPSTDPGEYVHEIVDDVVASWQNNPNPAPLPLRNDDGSEDPYAFFFDRGALGSASNPAPPAGQALVLDASFRSPARIRPALGSGTALGWDESLRVSAGGAIWTVSADGVVTRFGVQQVAASGSYPAYATVVALAESNALGAGAHALAVGELDSASAGDEVAVGTERWIHLLRASDLSVIRSRQLDFEHEQPRRMQIANLLPGSSTNPQLIFVTFYGHLMVLDHLLNTLTDFGEPGIEDFVVHEGASYASATTSSKVPITILSFRDHLANVTLNVPGPGPIPCPAQLHCWTEAQYGAGIDLERVTTAGGPMVAASFAGNGTVAPPVRLFDRLTLQPASPAGYGSPFTIAGGPNDMVAIHATGGSLAGFVVLGGQNLYWFPVSGTGGFLPITQYSPVANACALATADLSSPSSSGFVEELVVSTMPGHVVVFTMEEMLNAMTNPTLYSLSFDRPGQNGLLATALPPRTNHTVAATWGLISRWYTPDGDLLLPQLLAGNQAGELFEVDPPTGQTTYVIDLTLPGELPLSQPPSVGLPSYDPTFRFNVSAIRDLGVIGENALGVPPFYLGGFYTPDRSRRPTNVAPPGVRQLWWYRSLPNQNLALLPLSPHFEKEYLNFEQALRPTHIPVCTGVAAFIDGGAVQAYPPGTADGLVREFHTWGGSGSCDRNLIQGASVTATDIVNSWYSTKNISGTQSSPPPYGRSSTEGKDLRNLVPGAATYNLQSIRLGRDDVGPLIVAGTPGGGVTLLRPGNPHDQAAPNADFGTILWESLDPSPARDDGFGCMALAVRQAPQSNPQAIDIFQGATMSYPDPGAAVGQPGHAIVGSIRWMRWQGGAMTNISGPIFLDRTVSPGGQRDGALVSGLAVGDILDTVSGDELVVTTLAGDLYVFQLTTNSIVTPAIVHTWVPGALGAFNGIVIDDLDWDLRKELYVAGTQGIWKWRQV